MEQVRWGSVVTGWEGRDLTTGQCFSLPLMRDECERMILVAAAESASALCRVWFWVAVRLIGRSQLWASHSDIPQQILGGWGKRFTAEVTVFVLVGRQMSHPEFQLTGDQIQRIAKALADPQRFAILAFIAQQDEVPCKQLVAEFSITQATISHHLKELAAADLIHSRRQGQMAILSCRREICDAYTQMLASKLVQVGQSA